MADRVPDEAVTYRKHLIATSPIEDLRLELAKVDSLLATEREEHAKTLETLGRRDDQLHVAETDAQAVIDAMYQTAKSCMDNPNPIFHRLSDYFDHALATSGHHYDVAAYKDLLEQNKQAESRLAALPEDFKAEFRDGHVARDGVSLTLLKRSSVLRWLEERAGKEKG